MNIPATSILGFMGLLALGLGVLLILAGLDIFKVKQVTIKGGKKTLIAGAIFVVVGTLLLLPDITTSTQMSAQTPALTPTPTLSSSTTAIPTFTANPTITASSTLTPSITPELGIPVITAIKIREDNSSDGLIIYQDIYYYDPDGDTIFVQWKVISTTIADISVINGSVNASSEEQKAGTFTTGTWECNSGTYSIRFQATLLDKKGHESNPIEYSIECR